MGIAKTAHETGGCKVSFTKTVRVIESCQTSAQLETAIQYVKLEVRDLPPGLYGCVLRQFNDLLRKKLDEIQLKLFIRKEIRLGRSSR